MLEAEARMFEEFTDNYSQVIPIYTVTTEQTAKSYVKDMDIVAQKCARVVSKHPRSKWIDDCYFLVAKTYFYKRDYFSAIESFEYISLKYPKEKPGRMATIWLARSYLEQGKLDIVQAQIEKLSKSKLTKDKEWLTEFRLLNAQYHISRRTTEDYAKAISFLEKAMPGVKGKKKKIRYTFILAQLNQSVGKDKQAEKYYKSVARRNSAYELAFRSRLGLAEVSNDYKSVKKYLLKLTKDDKNLSYFDQIYYSLAKNELKHNNQAAGIDYLKLSTAKSLTNRNQKASSFLMLGDIYFANSAFPEAKNYYDSSARFIDNTYPDAEKFKARQEVLGDLIKNLVTIQQMDSLVRISLMDSASQRKFIENLILKDQERARQAAEAKNKAGQQGFQPPVYVSAVDNPSGNGEKYFYNPGALRQGQLEFKNKWGDRANQDNWRYVRTSAAERQASRQEKDTAARVKSPGAVNTANVPAQLQKYYEFLPRTNSQRNLMLKEVDNAIYAAGNIYYTRLNDEKKAIEYFETSIRRFPTGNNAPGSLYNLYLLYRAQGDTVKAQGYKNRLLENHPSSPYAAMINNPGAAQKTGFAKKTNTELEEMYAKAYAAGNSGHCDSVRIYEQQARKQFDKHYLIPKFAYLKHICGYKASSEYKLEDSLKAYVNAYPTSELVPQAKVLLRQFEDKRNEAKAQRNKDSARLAMDPNNMQKGGTGALEGGGTAPGMQRENIAYDLERQEPYYFIIVIGPKDNSNVVKTELSNYNSSQLPNSQLSVNASVFQTGAQLVYVTGFNDADEAQKYLLDLKKRPGFYDNMGLNIHKEAIISKTNFVPFFRNIDIDNYFNFYRQYLSSN